MSPNGSFLSLGRVITWPKKSCPLCTHHLVWPARCWEPSAQSEIWVLRLHHMHTHQLRSQKNPSSAGLRFHLQVQPISYVDFLYTDGRKHQGFQAPTAQPTVDGEWQLLNSICSFFVTFCTQKHIHQNHKHAGTVTNFTTSGLSLP